MPVIGQANERIIRLCDIKDTVDLFAFFHEVAHVILHFKTGRIQHLPAWHRELEADMFARAVLSFMYPEQEENFKEIFHTNPITEPYLLKMYWHYAALQKPSLN